MHLRQTYIATFEIEPGMRLARAVSNVSNYRLFQLPAGPVLTEENIRQLAVYDIHCVVIEEMDTRDDVQRAQDQARIERETQQIFSEANLELPAISALHSAVLAYRLAHV